MDVRVEEVNVLEAVHDGGPHPASLALRVGGVEVLHLRVVPSSPTKHL